MAHGSSRLARRGLLASSVGTSLASVHCGGRAVDANALGPMLDPDRTRALVVFTVRYANWAYWELLGMVRDARGQRDGGRWRLRSVVN